jgi:SAM-dependent methyltransferase
LSARASTSASKQYDRAYFEKWYRDPKHSIGSRQAVARKAQLAVAMAEYYLGRPIRSVLDVGCGEGVWRAPLKKLRPDIEYLGLDTSEYVIARYGRKRNLRLGSFGQLGELRFDQRFDLIVCSDMLHYVRSAEIVRGLRGIAELLEGIAFLELFTARDKMTGDHQGYIPRSPKWYLYTFSKAGLIAVGSHGYLGPHLKACVAALEVGASG